MWLIAEADRWYCGAYQVPARQHCSCGSRQQRTQTMFALQTVETCSPLLFHSVSWHPVRGLIIIFLFVLFHFVSAVAIFHWPTSAGAFATAWFPHSASQTFHIQQKQSTAEFDLDTRFRFPLSIHIFGVIWISWRGESQAFLGNCGNIQGRIYEPLFIKLGFNMFRPSFIVSDKCCAWIHYTCVIGAHKLILTFRASWCI